MSGTTQGRVRPPSPPCGGRARGPGAAARRSAAPPDPPASCRIPQAAPSPTILSSPPTTAPPACRGLTCSAAEGLVARHPGVGTVVVGQKYPHGLDRLMGLRKPSAKHGTVTNEGPHYGPAPAPHPVAQRLEVDPCTDVHRAPAPAQRPAPLPGPHRHPPRHRHRPARRRSGEHRRSPPPGDHHRRGPRPRRDHPGGGQRGRPLRRRTGSAARCGRPDAGTPLQHPPTAAPSTWSSSASAATA
ncbi:hypothetical protein SGLAM104S_09382 [Streptomyces glaucescens]